MVCNQVKETNGQSRLIYVTRHKSQACAWYLFDSHNMQERVPYNGISGNAALQAQSTQHSNRKGSVEDHYAAAEW